MKAKKTLEKYFSESDRLKAIIDEQQGINIHRRGGDAMASWLARSTLHRGSRARALAGNPGHARHCTVTVPLSIHPGSGCSKAVKRLTRIQS